MNLKTSLLVAGAASAGVIALAAAAVLSGSRSMPQPEAPPIARAVAPDVPRPDPRATGVIIASSNHYYYWMEPSGERGTLNVPPNPDNGVSSDGRWHAGIGWREQTPYLFLSDRSRPGQSGNWAEIDLGGSQLGGEWAPGASFLAALSDESLYLVDPSTSQATLVAGGVTAFAWGAGDRLIYATHGPDGAHLHRLDLGGEPSAVTALATPVSRFHVSPERDHLLFAQDDAAGWRLLGFDSADGALIGYGNMGHAAGVVVAEAPELAVAWSPLDTQFAVGPVSKPYVMHVVETRDGLEDSYSTYSFEEGYAGEMAWSPDGTQLAVSTYSLDRTQHEVYVLDMLQGALPRHLIDGCRIVWSPDGQFVAVKREPYKDPGLAVVRVDNGYHWPLTTHSQFVPVSWGAGRLEATAMAARPLPYAVQLGK